MVWVHFCVFLNALEVRVWINTKSLEPAERDQKKWIYMIYHPLHLATLIH